MNYEQKYKKVLEKAKKLAIDGYLDAIAIDDIFPELKESEDERMRKKCIAIVNLYYGEDSDKDEVLAWLKKPTRTNIEIPFGANDSELQEVSYDIPEGFYAEIKDDRVVIKEVETKFKVGDWIANGGANPYYVKSVFGDYYELCSCEGFEYTIHIKDVDYIYHLWTIQDTNDGDVLASKDGDDILIFRNLDTYISFSSYYNTRGKGEVGWFNNHFIPATKEQRDLLFQKMKQAGYEWDAEKKELVEIIPKKLDANEVIEWLERNSSMFWESPCNPNKIVELFKKDFEL